MAKFINSVLAVLFVMTSLSPMTSLADQYVAEVMVYLDQVGSDHWMKTTGKSQQGQFWEEMNSTFFEINEILKTMEPNGVEIQLQIADVIFMNKNILNTNNGKIVNTQSLKEFDNWLSPSYSKLTYDIAILFTGTNLVKNGMTDESNGYAYLGKVCSSQALGVVELSATYMDALVAAHEIGHILGADHDGFKGSQNCNSRSGEIMNPTIETSFPKHFFFSSCSAKSIKSKIEQLKTDNHNCMSRWYLSRELTGPRYASLMTPDEICKRKFGQGSYIARKAYSSYGDDVCVSVSCMTRTVRDMFYWTDVVTPQGLKCGKDKQCIQGKCIKTSGGSSQVSDRCPFGDQPKIEGRYQITCSQLNYRTCPNWNNTCCQTCPGTPDDVCRSVEGQSSTLARRAYSSYGNNLCSRLSCLTRVSGTMFHWNYHSAPDGMLCGKSKICSNGQCVTNTVFGDPDLKDSCPDGDQPWLGGDWQKSCPDYISQYGCDASGWNDTCCASCSDPGTADQVCRQREGTNSALARRAYSSYGNNLCSQLSCLTKVEGYVFNWNSRQAPEGMKCGKNRRCSGGKCILTKTGDPNISDWCPYGDQPWLAGNWKMTCKDYVTRNGCSGRGWKETCCSSCT